MANESVPVTLRHIARVRELLGQFAINLIRRGDVHDQSKFDPIEQNALDEMQRLVENDGPAPYGSDEYARRRDLLKPMLEHHYAKNPHHPEHRESGVAGMDLMDLIEMVADWRAANLDRDDGEPMNLTYSISRYRIEPQLAAIIQNTALRQGWRFK